MIRLGESEVTKIYKGESLVSAVYKGSVKIYPTWTLVEGFETASRFSSGSTARFSRSTLVAKSGSYSLLREVGNVGFMTVYANDYPVTSTMNKVFSTWVYIRSDRTTASACGLVLSTSSGNNGVQFLLDSRSGFPAMFMRTDYSSAGQTVSTVLADVIQFNTWYRMEMELKNGVVYGRLYNTDGVTLIDSIQRNNAYANGYLGLGAYSGVYFDKIEVKNS